MIILRYTLLLYLINFLSIFTAQKPPFIDFSKINNQDLLMRLQEYTDSHGLAELARQVGLALDDTDSETPQKIESALNFIIKKNPFVFFDNKIGFYFIKNSLTSNNPSYLFIIAEIIQKYKNLFTPQSEFYKILTTHYDGLNNETGIQSLLHACIHTGNSLLRYPARNSLDIFIQTLCIIAPELLLQHDSAGKTPLERALEYKNPNYIYLLCRYMQPKDIPLPHYTNTDLIQSILAQNHTVPFIPEINISLPVLTSFINTGLSGQHDISVVTLTLALQNNDFKIKGYQHLAQAYYNIGLREEPLIFIFILLYGIQQPYYPEIFTTAFTKNMRADQINSQGQNTVQYARLTHALPEVIQLLETQYTQEKLNDLHNDFSLIFTTILAGS